MKVVRDTMKQTLELWKEVADGASEEISAPPTQSRSSSMGKALHFLLRYVILISIYCLQVYENFQINEFFFHLLL